MLNLARDWKRFSRNRRKIECSRLDGLILINQSPLNFSMDASIEIVFQEPHPEENNATDEFEASAGAGSVTEEALTDNFEGAFADNVVGQDQGENTLSLQSRSTFFHKCTYVRSPL